MDAVAQGMPKREAATRFGIPYGTLQDKLTGRRKIVFEKKTILTGEEEIEIAGWLKKMSGAGFGRTKEELFHTIKSMLDFRGRTTAWKENQPTEKWFRLLKKRHPTLTFRKPQKLGKLRAFVTSEMVQAWHNSFTSTLKEINPTLLLEPERMFNCDESGFAIDALSNRILTDMASKYCYQVGSENRTMITALVCASASRHFIYPMLIYPGIQFRGFQPQEMFQESFISRSPNGWITQEIFTQWMEQVFVPQTPHLKKPVPLLVDGHVSHQSIRTSNLCQEHGIVLYCLLAHASHILQPLDVGVFKSMKGDWKNAVREYTFQSNEVLTKRNFAGVFKVAYNKTVDKNLCPMAFRKSGIFPANINAVDMSKVISSHSPPPTPQTPIATPPPAPRTPPVGSPTSPSAPATLSNLPVSSRTPSTTSAEHTAATAAPSSTVLLASESSTSLPADVDVITPTPTDLTTTQPCPSTPTTTPGPSPSSSQTSTGFSDTLHKYSMICAQIGTEKLNLFFYMLEEGTDRGDSLFRLWKVYHDEISNPKPRPSTTPQQDPLRTTPSVRSTSMREKKRKTVKFPDLMSGQEMVTLLEEKETEKQNEVRRKAERKVEQEQRKKELEKKKQERQKQTVERKKRQEQRKKEAERKKVEAQKKKNERQLQRILAESEKKKGKGKRKGNNEGDSDTPVEDDMVLESEGEAAEESEDSLAETLADAISTATEVCPVCKNQSSDQQWIQCERCKAWYHYSCVQNTSLDRMTQQDIESLAEFCCDFCL